MAHQLTDLIEQFCTFQRKQRGKMEGGVKTYRWMLEQFLIFVRGSEGRLARVGDLTPSTIQRWMDDMGASDLALSTMRSRQSALSSFCAWLVKARGAEREPGGSAGPTAAPAGGSETGAGTCTGPATWRSS